MSLSFKTDNVEISAVRDRIMFRSFTNWEDYIIRNIGDEFELTYSSSSLVVSMGTGEAVICGGSTIAEGTNEITLGANEEGYIVIRVDLAQIGNNICQLKKVPEYIHEDINQGGLIRDLELAYYRTNTNGVTVLTDLRNILGTPLEEALLHIRLSSGGVDVNRGQIEMNNGDNIKIENVTNNSLKISSQNSAYALESSMPILSAIRKYSNYNTFIKKDNSNCSDAPIHHKTDLAVIYFVRDTSNKNSNYLNGTCLWVDFVNPSVIFARSVNNSAWRENNWKLVGGRDLLWTNGSPSADFQRKTINLTNLSEYEKLLIEFRGYKSENFINSAIIPISPIVTNNITLLQTFRMGSSVFSIYGRQVRVEGNSVNFDLSNAWRQESPNFSRLDDNAVIIPLNIYGI